eukprot:CAMPEP_0196580680 /NCGR_PEP_ID=MMETSP1081-20130531/30032_1 /TAXON_ID=36882 /ORGANISM="Pyramimonas amylifera, Strain CCMP720" /LENGTH=115 /DNA_ID=CAMNT_0041900625 /DNA_START=95 /DNA_END=442 /DNA_ORIENTATION=-
MFSKTIIAKPSLHFVQCSRVQSTRAVRSFKVVGALSAGQRVKVTADVKVYHILKTKGAETALQGFEGVVDSIIEEHKGLPLSANLPVKVKLTGEVGELGEVSFIAHLCESELEEI